MFGIEKRRQKRIEEKQRKEREEREKKKKSIKLMLALITAMMMLASFPSFAMILFGAMTVLLLPIEQIDYLWDKLLHDKKKTFKPIILAVMFVVACMTAPLDEQNSDNLNTDNTVSSSIEDNVADVTEEGTSEIIGAASESSSEATSTEEKTTEATSTEEKTTEEKITDEKTTDERTADEASKYVNSTIISIDEIPEYSGNAYVSINDNIPFFTDDEMITEAFEYYSDLDSLGRCGVAYANVCVDIMPTEERGEIGSVKPTGWHTVKYDIVSGKYLYNRCHLIGYQLSAENANTKNLITGTRYLNVEGMLPFENMVADYVKETNNHVLYRVTPMFAGENLLCSGVLIEAKSVEDNGAGILFNVYCYNVQPGIIIDYLTGDSSLDETESSQASTGNDSRNTGTATASTIEENKETETATSTSSDSTVMVHITDTGSKYHRAGCRYLKSDTEVTLEKAKALGLTPCGSCNPPQ